MIHLYDLTVPEVRSLIVLIALGSLGGSRVTSSPRSLTVPRLQRSPAMQGDNHRLVLVEVAPPPTPQGTPEDKATATPLTLPQPHL